jgi:hypothetical protein
VPSCEELERFERRKRLPPLGPPLLPPRQMKRTYHKVRCLVCGRRIGVNNWMRHFRAHLRRVVE